MRGMRMQIAGLQKTSFIDFPGKPCAVVFTPRCNMNCSYCHNAHILFGSPKLIPEEEVYAFLEKRAGLISALTISGGEPTLQRELRGFIERVRPLGYAVKLDTNGLRPDVLNALIRDGLVDYVAMDIKGPLEKYDLITRTKNDLTAIKKSIAILRSGAVPHEFRTTFFPELTPADVVNAAKLVRGAERYYLQQYISRDEADPPPYPPSVVDETAELVKQEIGVCTVRGLGDRGQIRL